eukprot:CAMPEP_0181429598 /NCGR_PEP_ID=MMETSP1110-20121109/17284_1 /TAXON_ID=174948 /ORGANISM="Symbiodinium sp., Strain CCMP421" /LENGTH=84 /DNA_ID=CAMNT_0023552875 /DNA_START=94 /DNA_END=345 /DNA_ORIENTATION=+
MVESDQCNDDAFPFAHLVWMVKDMSSRTASARWKSSPARPRTVAWREWSSAERCISRAADTSRAAKRKMKAQASFWRAPDAPER